MERHRIKEWEKKMMEHVARADRLMPGYWVAIRPWTFEKFRPDMIKYLKEKMNMGAAEASTLLAELSSRLFDV